jgi:hypothetical protein
MYQVFTATFSSVAMPLLANDRVPADALLASCSVTPDSGVIVKAVLLLTMLITVPTSNATDALSGTMIPLVM